MLERLKENARTGLDGSPGDPVAAWAVARIAALEDTLRELIKSPDGVRRLDHLRRGIGTATPDRVWLDAEKMVGNQAAIAVAVVACDDFEVGDVVRVSLSSKGWTVQRRASDDAYPPDAVAFSKISAGQSALLDRRNGALRADAPESLEDPAAGIAEESGN